MPHRQCHTPTAFPVYRVSPDNWDQLPQASSVSWMHSTELTHVNGKKEASGRELAKKAPHHNTSITHAGSFLKYSTIMQYAQAYRVSEGFFCIFLNSVIRLFIYLFVCNLKWPEVSIEVSILQNEGMINTGRKGDFLGIEPNQEQVTWFL